MKVQRNRRIICLMLILAMLITMISGCGTNVQANDIMKGIMPNDVSDEIEITEEGNVAVADFAVRLFRYSLEEEKSTLISPISVLYVLAMTANGADGNTLAQMEHVLGMPVDEWNKHLGAYKKQLSNTSDSKLFMANSIWFKDSERFSVKEDFLQVNADYYNSEIYKSAFDETTLDDINNWVKKNTDGMIEKIIEDKISDDALMYLVNALSFEAEWQEIYKENQVRTGTFTKEDGANQEVTMMHSDESLYLEDELATGFIKKYSDGKYAFAAVLPNEGVSVKEYVSNLTGDKLAKLLNNPIKVSVKATMPKFDCEYNVEMSSVLKRMGIIDAFEYPTANFSKMGTLTNKASVIAIERVLHKTYISVGEKGTKAGAATAVEMVEKMAMMYPEDMKTVCLDRPFLYMIIDTETNSPIFMGTVMDIGK